MHIHCYITRYRQAVANVGQISVSPPYLDAFGAGVLVTISKALFYAGYTDFLVSHLLYIS